MPLTILSDLDGTLLGTDVNHFFFAFFHELENAIHQKAPNSNVIQQLQYAEDQMIANTNPSLWLKEVFAQHFYEPLGTTEKECEGVLDFYYRNEFPKLQALTQRRPEAAEIANWCQDQGSPLVIATNPVFPTISTRQRLAWAGLREDQLAFYSTYDNFHFIKPTLNFYAECLGRLGWPDDGPVAMLGDDPVHDIQPMEALGCRTFFVTEDEVDEDLPHGNLTEALAWLKSLPEDEPHKIPENSEVHTAILRTSPAVIADWLQTASNAALHAKPSPTDWNLTEVIWHMADMENEVYLPQWKQILKDSKTILEVPDTSHWAATRDYQSRSAEEGLRRLTSARMESLNCIETMSNRELMALPLRHAVFSQTTPAELVSFSAKHDRIHLNQSRKLLNRSI